MSVPGTSGAKAIALALAATLLAGCPQGGAGAARGEALKDGMKVRVGVVLELTGNNATFGEETRNGLEMAIDDLRTKAPWTMDLVTLDNKSDAQETQRAVQQLVEVHNVCAIIGAVGSTKTMAGGKIAQESQVPMCSPGSTNKDVTLRDDKKTRADYISRVCFIDPFQGEVCARFALNDLKKKAAALVIDKANDYAIGLGDGFRAYWTKNGGQIVTEENYIEGETDFSAVIRKVAEAKPDVIFIPGYYNDAGPMLKQAKDAWKSIPKIGGDGWDSPDLFALAGADALSDCYLSSHYAPDDETPIVRDFVTRYKAKHKKDPGSMSVLGFDAGLFIHDSIKRAGSTDPTKIKDAINSAKGVQGVSGLITIDESGNPQKEAVILAPKDGKFTLRARFKPGQS